MYTPSNSSQAHSPARSGRQAKGLAVPTDTRREEAHAAPAGSVLAWRTFDAPVVRQVQPAPPAVVESGLLGSGRIVQREAPARVHGEALALSRGRRGRHGERRPRGGEAAESQRIMVRNRIAAGTSTATSRDTAVARRAYLLVYATHHIAQRDRLDPAAPDRRMPRRRAREHWRRPRGGGAGAAPHRQAARPRGPLDAAERVVSPVRRVKPRQRQGGGAAQRLFPSGDRDRGPAPAPGHPNAGAAGRVRRAGGGAGRADALRLRREPGRGLPLCVGLGRCDAA